MPEVTRPDAVDVPRAVRFIARAVPRFYPRRLRHDHGQEMENLVVAKWRFMRSRRVRLIALVFGAWLARDLIRSVPREFVRHRHHPAGRSPMFASGSNVRLAMRSVVRRPGFLITVILTIGLGVGTATAVFSAVDAVLLKPLPYRDQGSLVVLRHAVPGYGGGEWGLSAAGYFAVREQNRVFDEIAISTRASAVLTGEGDPERLAVAPTTWTLFSLLGVSPMLGRPYLADDDRPGGEDVIVLSHGIWARRFGADPDLVGRAIMVNGRPFRVIGIMPPAFAYPTPDTDAWWPLRLDPGARPVNAHYYQGIGRLRPDVTIAAATDDLETLVNRFPEQLPSAYSEQFLEESGFTPVVRPLLDSIVGDMRASLWIVLATSALVLVVAAANASNLVLVRAEAKRAEMALRSAVGASGYALLRHVLTENAVLAACGGVLGLGVAWAATGVLQSIAPLGLPRMDEIAIDLRAIGVALGITGLVWGILVVAAGARHVMNPLAGLGQLARRTSISASTVRIRSALVVVQVTMALLLLVGAGLLLRSFQNLRRVDPGFTPQNVLTMQLAIDPQTYRTKAEQDGFFQQMVDRVAELEGVAAAGAALDLPLISRPAENATEVGDQASGSINAIIDTRFVGAGFLDAMGMRLIEGRLLTKADMDSTNPGAVVTRALADQFWPGQSAIGKRIRPLIRPVEFHSVVGVIDDVRTTDLAVAPEPTVYFPLNDLWGVRASSIAVRSSMPTDVLVGAIRRELAAIDPNVPIAGLAEMNDVVGENLAPMTFTLTLLAVAAGMTLLLGGVGIYGVIAYIVGDRTFEIGVRMALGASQGHVIRMVMLRTMALAGVGVVLGLVASGLVTRYLQSLLFEITPSDPVTLLGVSGLLAVIALVAGVLPARRATRVDPTAALRME